MLKITKKTKNGHKKALLAEVFISLMLFVVFLADFVQASDITAQMVVELTNKARQSAQVAMLEKNDLLEIAAQRKAQDMFDKNYFAHVSPEGKSPWDWINDTGYDYRYAGENLAIDFVSAEQQQEAWMDSPLHRKNILNSEYEQIGVAVKQGIINGQKTIITVQEFGTKMPAATTDVENSQENGLMENVAGTATSSLSYDAQKISDQMELNALFENNTFTLVGWFSVFGIILLVIVIDVAAVFHQKHRQLLILHDARKKNA